MHRICSFNMVVKIYSIINLKTFYGQSSSLVPAIRLATDALWGPVSNL